jgi:hypothetical protein
MRSEEAAVIKAAKRWARKANADSVADLLLAVQALKVAVQPLQGPEPIPCMVRASHSATMFCRLPKGHEGSEPNVWPACGGGYTFHEGVAANGNGVRRFKVWVDVS